MLYIFLKIMTLVVLSISVVRGDRGDVPQAWGEARRNNAPCIAGEARAQMRLTCASRMLIASMRLLFVGQVGLQPANLAGKPGLLKLDKK